MRSQPQQPEQAQLPVPANHTTGPPPGPGASEDDKRATMRNHTTGLLLNLLHNLNPYIDGTLGDISPRHASTYVAACRELNRVWDVTYREPDHVDDEPDPVAVARARAAAVRAQVLDQLATLRTRGGDGRS